MTQARKRWGIWFFVPLIGMFIVLSALANEWRHSMKIHRILVGGARIIPADQIAENAGVPVKTPMFGVNLFDVRQKLLVQPFIKTVYVNRQFPDALLIDIVERQPIASLTGTQLRYVDAEGVLLPYMPAGIQFNVPVISGIEGLERQQVGVPARSEKLSRALEILTTGQQLDTMIYQMISEVHVGGEQEITLYSTDGGVPIYFGSGDVAKKLLLLQTFWNNFIRAEDAEKMQYVDLRFDGQVVVKWVNRSEPESAKIPL